MAGSGSLSPIDWDQPWFSSVAPAGILLSGVNEEPLCNRLNRLLVTASASSRAGRPQMDSGKPIVFAPQSDLRDGVPYETYIHDTGRVPTRDNLHDLFNALVWLSFPHIKSRLNATQAQALRRPPPLVEAGMTGRGAVRDAVTIFDENGLVLACSNDELAAALRRFDWQTLFVEQRTATLVQTEPWVVGHALMEKLVSPYKSITAHTLIVPVDDSYFRACYTERRTTIDRLVSDWLANWPFFTTRDLAPLPVLGLPGWWAANTAPGFYDDTEVFRTGRTRQR